MIYHEGKPMGGVYHLGKAMQAAYHLGVMVWQQVLSCFGKGYWINDQPWNNDDAWNNG